MAGLCPECGRAYELAHFNILDTLRVVREVLPAHFRPGLQITRVKQDQNLAVAAMFALFMAAAYVYGQYLATHLGLWAGSRRGDNHNFFWEFGYYGNYGPKVQMSWEVFVFFTLIISCPVVFMSIIIYMWYAWCSRKKVNGVYLRRVGAAAAAGMPFAIAPFLFVAVVWQVFNSAVPRSYHSFDWYFEGLLRLLFGGTDWVALLALGVLVFGIVGMIRIFVIHRRAIQTICLTLPGVRVIDPTEKQARHQ